MNFRTGLSRLTPKRIADARAVLAAADQVDITNPDLPRRDVAALVTRLTENLRTVTNQAEYIDQIAEELHGRTDQLLAENAKLKRRLAKAEAARDDARRAA